MTHILLGTIGLLAAPLAGAIIIGLDRRLTARLQSRIGPPIAQPLYDVLKLLGKELVVSNVWQAFCAYSYLAGTAVAVFLFFAGSDLLVIFLVQAAAGIFLVVGALSSTSPFSQVGGYRELIQTLACEPLLMLIFVGIYLETGSFRLSDLFDQPRPLILRLPLLCAGLLLVMAVKLRKSPFDFAASRHAHQELVSGVMTDYAGPVLAMIEVGHWYETVLIIAIAAIFWATAWWGMLTLAAAAFGTMVVLDNVTARVNWRWLVGVSWLVGIPLAMMNLLWL